ncbi:MAG: type II toxin-antitoxin system CcdA family antitoxin [Candidatus Dormibacterales bacterium]
MATIRTTFSLEEELAERARKLGVNVSAAAREGVAAAVRSALARLDQEAYRRHPERADSFWDDNEAWTQD